MNNITLKTPVYLDYDVYSMQIWYTSVHKPNWLSLTHYK